MRKTLHKEPGYKSGEEKSLTFMVVHRRAHKTLRLGRSIIKSVLESVLVVHSLPKSLLRCLLSAEASLVWTALTRGRRRLFWQGALEWGAVLPGMAQARVRRQGGGEYRGRSDYRNWGIILRRASMELATQHSTSERAVELTVKHF